MSREVERTYEELRTRKIDVEEAVRRGIDFSERIVKWKTEEKEIGKNYPLYEALRIVLPNIEKQNAISFVNDLSERLEQSGLLFPGWQMQRDVRRRVKSETRVSLLTEYKGHRDKLTNSQSNFSRQWSK